MSNPGTSAPRNGFSSERVELIDVPAEDLEGIHLDDNDVVENTLHIGSVEMLGASTAGNDSTADNGSAAGNAENVGSDERRVPIFVDSSGQRARIVRRAGYAVTGLCAAYTAMLGLSLAGATSIAPSTLLPVPGVPTGPLHTLTNDAPKPADDDAKAAAQRPKAKGLHTGRSGGKGFVTSVELPTNGIPIASPAESSPPGGGTTDAAPKPRPAKPSAPKPPATPPDAQPDPPPDTEPDPPGDPEPEPEETPDPPADPEPDPEETPDPPADPEPDPEETPDPPADPEPDPEETPGLPILDPVLDPVNDVLDLVGL